MKLLLFKKFLNYIYQNSIIINNFFIYIMQANNSYPHIIIFLYSFYIYLNNSQIYYDIHWNLQNKLVQNIILLNYSYKLLNNINILKFNVYQILNFTSNKYYLNYYFYNMLKCLLINNFHFIYNKLVLKYYSLFIIQLNNQNFNNGH